MFKLRSVLSDYVLMGCIFCVGQVAILCLLFQIDAFTAWQAGLGFITKYTSAIPADLKIVTSGLMIGLVLLSFMAIGLFFDMIGSRGTIREMKTFVLHLRTNRKWWRGFEQRYRAYLGDSRRMINATKSRPLREIATWHSLSFAGESIVFGSKRIWRTTKLIYLLAIICSIPAKYFLSFPATLRDDYRQRKATNKAIAQFGRAQIFLFSFVMNHADGTKGDLITDEIRVWKMNKIITTILTWLSLEVLLKYLFLAGQAFYVMDKTHPPQVGVIILLMIPFLLATIGGAALVELTGGLISRRSYSRLCTSLFAASYVGYSKILEETEEESRIAKSRALPAAKAQNPPHAPTLVELRLVLNLLQSSRTKRFVIAAAVLLWLASGVALSVQDHMRRQIVDSASLELDKLKAVNAQLASYAKMDSERVDEINNERKALSDNPIRPDMSEAERNKILERTRQLNSRASALVALQAAELPAFREQELQAKSLGTTVDARIADVKAFDARYDLLGDFVVPYFLLGTFCGCLLVPLLFVGIVKLICLKPLLEAGSGEPVATVSTPKDIVPAADAVATTESSSVAH